MEEETIPWWRRPFRGGGDHSVKEEETIPWRRKPFRGGGDHSVEEGSLLYLLPEPGVRGRSTHTQGAELQLP